MTKMRASYLGDLQTECVHESGAKIVTDAPKDHLGKGGAFSPTDLLAASLATCMLTLMGIAARKVGLELKGASAEVEKEIAPAGPRRLGKIVVRIRSALSPNGPAREKLEQAALECPVKLSLHPEVKLEVDFVWGL